MSSPTSTMSIVVDLLLLLSFMVRLTDPLNDTQVAVLKWIADGCPEGVMHGFSYKTTAKALQDRRLVSVSRKRGAWQAQITEAGRFYLQHGRHPGPPRAVRPRAEAGVRTASNALTRMMAGEAAVAMSDNVARRAAPRNAAPSAPSAMPPTRSHPMRYRVVVSRVQIAERFVRAVNEEDAAKKVQEELDRPYGFLGGWRTTDTDLDVVAAESPLTQAPVPLSEDGSALMSIKQAAGHLCLSQGMMYELVRTGEIEHVAIGTRKFISREGLKTFIEANTRRGVRYR
jgi:excisionase family DNA binding protein